MLHLLKALKVMRIGFPFFPKGILFGSVCPATKLAVAFVVWFPAAAALPLADAPFFLGDYSSLFVFWIG